MFKRPTVTRLDCRRLLAYSLVLGYHVQLSLNFALPFPLLPPDAGTVLGLFGLKPPWAPDEAASISVTSVGVMKNRSSCQHKKEGE